MEVDRKELSLIKEVLKSNPRGMTVTEISKEIKMNRHSVAKYLEILAVSGHIDMKSFGPSKVYYISQRLPISAMLSFSSDFIIILDQDLRIVNVNEKFLEFADLNREDIIHKNLETFSFPLEFEPSIIPSVKEALDGKESIIEAVYEKRKVEVYFFIKFIPTVFDDGEKGITIIFENITERKQSEKSIRESEQKFRSVIEQSLDGIILTDIHGRILEFNKISENITGLMREQVVGKTLWDAGFNVNTTISDQHIKIKKILDNLKNVFSSYMKTGKAPINDQLIELDLKHADGSLITVQITYFSIISDNGHMFCIMMRDITSKKMIERAIIESEEKFRSIIEQTVNGVILIDKNGVIIEYNRAQEMITGYKRDEIIGKYAWDFQNMIIPGEKRSLKINSKNDLLSLIKNGEAPFAYKIHEIEILRRDGGRRVIRMIIFPIKMSIGFMICSITYDITEQKKIEIEIKENEQKFRSIIEQSTDGFILTDEEGRIIEFNKAMENISGHTREDNLDKYLWDSEFFKEIISKTDGRRPVHVKETIEKYLKTGTSPISDRIIESDIKRKNGTISTQQIVVFPIKTEQGYKIGGITRDITERKKIENELKESEEKFRSLAESTTNGIIILQSGHIVYTNPAVENISGYTIADVLGKSMSGMVSSEYTSLMKKAVNDVHLGNMPNMEGHSELKILNKSGDFIWLEYTIGKLNYQGKPAIIITFFDVTHRKTIEEELQKAHDDLEQRVRARTHELELANKSLHSEIEQRILSENALLNSENRYKYLVENINDIICETDKDNRYVYVSPRVRDILGYDPAELLNKTPYDIMRKDEQKRIIDIFENNIRNNEPLTPTEIYMTHKDGRQVPVEISARQIIDEDGNIIGYNAIVRDLMQRKIAEEKIVSLASFPELDPNPVIEVNAKEQIIYMNKSAKETFPGLAPGHPMVGGLKPVYNEFKNGGLRSYSREIKLDSTVYNQFIYYVPKQDALRIYAADITKRKKAEDELQIVNRALRMVNDCNQTLVRAVNEKQLLEDICRIIVEKGGYRLAWVGFIAKDRPNMIVPAVRMGYDNGYVDSINIILDDAERGSGPTGTAIKSGQPAIARYTATDPSFAPWREEALKRGYASTVALPLRSKGSSIGCLSIYSTKADAFDPAELKLLMELADDLTYGLMSLRAGVEREKAEETLQLMKSTIDFMEDAAFWVGKDSRLYYVNESTCRELGYTKEELLSMSIADIDPTFKIENWAERWEQIKSAGASKIKAVHKRKDGSTYPVEIFSNYIDSNGRQYDFAFSRRLHDTTVEEVMKYREEQGI